MGNFKVDTCYNTAEIYNGPKNKLLFQSMVPCHLQSAGDFCGVSLAMGILAGCVATMQWPCVGTGIHMHIPAVSCFCCVSYPNAWQCMFADLPHVHTCLIFDETYRWFMAKGLKMNMHERAGWKHCGYRAGMCNACSNWYVRLDSLLIFCWLYSLGIGEPGLHKLTAS